MGVPPPPSLTALERADNAPERAELGGDGMVDGQRFECGQIFTLASLALPGRFKIIQYLAKLLWQEGY